MDGVHRYRRVHHDQRRCYFRCTTTHPSTWGRLSTVRRVEEWCQRNDSEQWFLSAKSGMLHDPSTSIHGGGIFDQWSDAKCNAWFWSRALWHPSIQISGHQRNAKIRILQISCWCFDRSRQVPRVQPDPWKRSSTFQIAVPFAVGRIHVPRGDTSLYWVTRVFYT